MGNSGEKLQDEESNREKSQTFQDTINVCGQKAGRTVTILIVPEGNKKQGYLQCAPCALVQHPPWILQVRLKRACSLYGHTHQMLVPSIENRLAEGLISYLQLNVSRYCKQPESPETCSKGKNTTVTIKALPNGEKLQE